MKNTVTFGSVACAVFLLVSAPLASAHDRSGVRWSVTIGSSYPAQPIYAPPPVVYVPAQPVYVQPHPAYVQPHPTYIQPHPHPSYVIPPPVYVQPIPSLHFSRGGNEHHWHHRHDNHGNRPFRSHGPGHRHN